MELAEIPILIMTTEDSENYVQQTIEKYIALSEEKVGGQLTSILSSQYINQMDMEEIPIFIHHVEDSLGAPV